MSDFTQLKNNLLSSGLPLEYAVKQVLESLGVWDAKEFSYERINEVGIPVVFSIDVHATKSYYSSNEEIDAPYAIYVELFVECKYRHDNIKWIFTPDEFERDISSPSYEDIFMILDQINTTYRINRSDLDKFARPYKLCRKGLEFSSKDKNPESIKHSIQQLKFAIPYQVLNALEHQTRPYLGSVEPLFVLIPIVVTTADLWRLKPNIKIEDIRASKKLDDIATQEHAIILFDPPDDELSKHTKRILCSTFESDEVSEIDKRLKSDKEADFLMDRSDFFMNESADGQFESFINIFSARNPKLFLVIQLDKFENIVQKILSIFGASKIIEYKNDQDD